MHLFLGSTNPVKINAVTIAISETFPDAVVQGIDVDSGVSAQPMSDQETRVGAENRAKAALAAGIAGLRGDPGYLKSQSDSGSGMTDFIGVGMEGGVFENEDGELWNTVWCCVVDESGQVFCANGERFKLPEILAKEIRDGKEMGPAMDALVGSTNIKQHGGMIGEITHGFIDRTEMYTGLAKLALGLWHGRDWEGGLANEKRIENE